jgi:glycosyltransferase involved in cell wall biosynthesis
LHVTAHRLGIAERVRFLGQRSDVPALMAAADIYCQPNTGPEGFGLTLVEALRAGCPVITSALGGALEIVGDNCGILCPPGNVEAVAEALRKLITDPAYRKRLAQAGPIRATELCAPERQLPALAATLLPTKVC